MLKKLRVKNHRGKQCCYLLLRILILFILILCFVEITSHSMKSEETITWYTKSMGEQEIIEEIKIEDKAVGISNKKNRTNIVKQVKEEQRVIEDLYSKEDILILEKIVEAETTGEDFRSRVLVANVVLNRVKSKSFPNTVEEVVFQKTGNTYQFSPVYDGRYYKVTVSEVTKKAVQYAIKNADKTKGALYFANRHYADRKNMEWFDQNLRFLFSYGAHEFFTEKN